MLDDFSLAYASVRCALWRILSRFGSVSPQDAYLFPSVSFFSVSCMP
jgi:hypothetical protein